MTSHRIKGTIQFECDDCGDAFDAETADWFNACTALAAAEWKPRKLADGTWEHTCPTCILRARRKRDAPAAQR